MSDIQFNAHFCEGTQDPKDTPPPTRVETKDERKERKRKERAEQIAYKLEQDLALWDPAGTIGSSTDPYKSLFIARINYDTSESKLRREFEVHGPIRKISLICDKFSGKPRGYAFIEYEHERDMHSAYKHADGKKIDGRRVLVDVERGRTVKGWRPRRLGGGLGGTRKGGPDENTRFSGRDDFSGNGNIRDERRERSPSRERRRRSRSRERRPRSRSREKRRERSRSRDRSRKDGMIEEERNRRRSRSRDRKRSRSRERVDRKRRRSRSREIKRERDENGVPVPEEMGDMEEFVPPVKQERADPAYEQSLDTSKLIANYPEYAQDDDDQEEEEYEG
ncbi:hypothetical protein CHS0354_024528 [Potamilus streckersoni]|uniref:U1 small nuclear ribonucleoprotein 70 kDa n=1 Tax=Potamilus streckersoni TaxID=2493646 RepID=A0AAE0TN17_9BIVA|nr:hypothetical protein CHS0354_024528 [Potamilus streckersoni]